MSGVPSLSFNAVMVAAAVFVFFKGCEVQRDYARQIEKLDMYLRR